MGGETNAVAIVRSLGRRGIPVHVAADADCTAFESRYCGLRFPVPSDQELAPYLTDLLIDRDPGPLAGSVLFPCSDHAIEFVADHHQALTQRFRLPEFVPDLQRDMLDKRRTLELAQAAGVPVPGYWMLGDLADLEARRAQTTFPVMIKPTHSHLFQRAFGGRKFFTAGTFDELVQRARQVKDHGLEAMVCEIIPGPDTLLSSYYVYVNNRGEELFHFTKRVIRRNPMNEGPGSYHITEWLPETAEVGKRFFRGIGFRGLGNIEFKRDPRDNTLKVIECNARFTAAQWILVRAGLDIAHLIYNDVVGLPATKIKPYREFVRLWYPIEDYWAFKDLRSRGLLSFWGWLRSIMHRQTLPYFTVTDPRPAWVVFSRVVGEKLRRMTGAVPP